MSAVLPKPVLIAPEAAKFLLPQNLYQHQEAVLYNLPDIENLIIVSDVFILNLNSVNQLIFVMVKCGVLFEVRTGFLNNI
jgi:hypothetical protein